MHEKDKEKRYSFQSMLHVRRPISTARFEYYKTDPPNLHFHDAHEILLIEQGQYKIYAPQLTYEGSGPCIVLFKHGIYHGCVRMECEKTSFLCYVTNYHQSIIDNYPSDMVCFKEMLTPNNLIIPIDKATFNTLLPTVKKLQQYSDSYNKDMPVPTQMHGHFLSLLNFIYELSDTGIAAESTPDSDDYISEVIRIIIDSIERGEDVSVSDLAEKFYVSRSKLSKDFNKATGINIKQMIDELKLKRIKEMLKKGKDNKEVARLCGFSNDSYFIQFFNKHMNMSPGNYRQMHTKKTTIDL